MQTEKDVKFVSEMVHLHNALNRPSIPSFLATQIVYIGYGQVFF
jgi:hypothetical protein